MRLGGRQKVYMCGWKKKCMCIKEYEILTFHVGKSTENAHNRKIKK